MATDAVVSETRLYTIVKEVPVTGMARTGMAVLTSQSSIPGTPIAQVRMKSLVRERPAASPGKMSLLILGSRTDRRIPGIQTRKYSSP